ncbi:MAG: glycoside hydrolase family 2 protein [Planctomycetota bacterium]|jgi:beta-galactosidase/beta-glucuronidase
MPTIAAERLDHPRPDRRRSGWVSLNGPWAFTFDDADAGLARGWSDRSDAFDRSIVVPFVPQCAASGVGDAGRHEILWYRRVFENPAGPGERLLLHFGAVDHEATVWLNGVEVGRHRGGYTPFSFDVTDPSVPGENALVVRAVDRFRPDQVRGKQTPTFPYLISYTAASGIWQAVWLEVTGPSTIGDLDLRSDAASGRLGVVATVRGEASSAVLEVRVSRGGRAVAAAVGQAGDLVTLDVPEPSLWSPAAPTLYDVELVLRAPGGESLDHLHTYTGFRSVEIRNGRWLLNGEPVLQRLLLDQGYWPDSNLTPPSDDAIRADLEYLKAAGFTGVRKHQKIEDPRWLWWADRLGVLVWAEMPSPFPLADIDGPLEADFRREWADVVRRDRLHPAVVCWVPFNESWGVLGVHGDSRRQRLVADVVADTRRLDPTRPVCDNSGWGHVDTDVIDGHDYSQDPARLHATWNGIAARGYERPPAAPDPEVVKAMTENLDLETLAAHLGVAELAEALPFLQQDLRLFADGCDPGDGAVVVSEMGGVGLVLPGDELPAGAFVYHRVESAEALLERFRALVTAVESAAGVEGWCWTQLADVEQEVNGLLTADRRPKLDAARIASVFSALDARRSP